MNKMNIMKFMIDQNVAIFYLFNTKTKIANEKYKMKNIPIIQI